MGGYGAFKMALRCPGKFAAAGSFSGVLDMNAAWKRNDLDNDGEMRNVFGSPEALRGSGDDLLAEAERLAAAPGPKPRLYQCCGTEDFLYRDNLTFRDHARKLGLDLTYEEDAGTHEWGYWDRKVHRFLHWLQLPKR